ncbi:MAG TPA: flagellar biosynthetic protein FliR, partial [Caballeronia sp.]|nr:flagellar biosynthetic protein FliR [Caballeronia sp.]
MLLVFARGAGLMFRAPGFTHPSVPLIVRLGMALVLAVCVAPGVAGHAEMDTAAFGLAIAAEIALGTAMGMGASLLYDGAYYAGRMIDDYVGVRGSVPNAAVTSAQGFGRLWSSVFL